MYTEVSNSKEADSALWLAFCEGNQMAFSMLYKKYYPILYSYGKSMNMESLLVRDAIQDIFVKIYLHPHLVQEVSTLRPFLFQSIKNHLINTIKKEARLTGIEDVETNFSFSYQLDNEIIEKEEQKAIRHKIDKLLSSLSPRQKEIIYLRFLYEMEFDEIAKIMSISYQSARNLLHKAMDKMRKKGEDSLLLLLFYLYHLV